MLCKRIIPCLDIKAGRVVKGINFINIRDAGDPVEVAKLYNEAGADELVFLDITATLEKRDTLIELVKKIAAEIFIPFTVGGGIRTVEDIKKVLQAGADKISLNSAAVINPELIREAAERFGSQCIVVAIDVKRRDNGAFEVVINSGTKFTGKEALAWAQEVEALGAGEILLTSMDKDGTKTGFDVELTRLISEALNIPVIASGGAGKISDFADVFLEGKADAALAASLFHFKEVEIPILKDYLSLRSLPMRYPLEKDKRNWLESKAPLPNLAFAQLKTNEVGLISAIVREENSGIILMQAWLNEVAWEESLKTGLMHYFSRSRNAQWLKGETSGHFQQIRNIWIDCDADCLLVDVFQLGPACHTGHHSCFYRQIETLIEDK